MKITHEQKKTLSFFAIIQKGEIFPSYLFEINKNSLDRRTKRIISLVKNGYLQAKKEIVNEREYLRINLTDQGRQIVCK